MTIDIMSGGICRRDESFWQTLDPLFGFEQMVNCRGDGTVHVVRFAIQLVGVGVVGHVAANLFWAYKTKKKLEELQSRPRVEGLPKNIAEKYVAKNKPLPKELRLKVRRLEKIIEVYRENTSGLSREVIGDELKKVYLEAGIYNSKYLYRIRELYFEYPELVSLRTVTDANEGLLVPALPYIQQWLESKSISQGNQLLIRNAIAEAYNKKEFASLFPVINGSNIEAVILEGLWASIKGEKAIFTVKLAVEVFEKAERWEYLYSAKIKLVECYIDGGFIDAAKELLESTIISARSGLKEDMFLRFSGWVQGVLKKQGSSKLAEAAANVFLKIGCPAQAVEILIFVPETSTLNKALELVVEQGLGSGYLELVIEARESFGINHTAAEKGILADFEIDLFYRKGMKQEESEAIVKKMYSLFELGYGGDVVMVPLGRLLQLAEVGEVESIVSEMMPTVPSEAAKAVLKAAEIFGNAGFPLQQAKYLKKGGSLFKKMGKLGQAREAYEKAVEITSNALKGKPKVFTKADRAHLFRLRGDAYMGLENFVLAGSSYYESALEFSSESVDEVNRSLIKRAVANILGGELSRGLNQLYLSNEWKDVSLMPEEVLLAVSELLNKRFKRWIAAINELTDADKERMFDRFYQEVVKRFWEVKHLSSEQSLNSEMSEFFAEVVDPEEVAGILRERDAGGSIAGRTGKFKSTSFLARSAAEGKEEAWEELMRILKDIDPSMTGQKFAGLLREGKMEELKRFGLERSETPIRTRLAERLSGGVFKPNSGKEMELARDPIGRK